MLGRNHLTITLASFFPFVIPVIFGGFGDFLIYVIVFCVALALGSLMPDADCGGKPKLYYDFPIIYDIMQPITSVVIFIFRKLRLYGKIEVQYEVNNEHRGIMHAPIGILMSSLLLSVIPIIIMALISTFDWVLALIIFLGLFVGQIMHILEDSMTVAGINWMFPFGTKEIRGKIYTFEKEEGKKDIRPSLYYMILGIASIVLLVGYALDQIKMSPWFVYLILVCYLIIVWLFIFAASRTEWSLWYWKAETIEGIKRETSKMRRGFGKQKS